VSRLIKDLDPKVQPIARDFTERLASKGIRYVVLETRRPRVVQVAYYSRGRDDYETVAAKYRAAGLAIPTPIEARTIITRTMYSKHLSGLALDVVPLAMNGTVPWSVRNEQVAELWFAVGACGEAAGLQWGGRWPDPQTKQLGAFGLGWDLPHYEYA
jgi:hypothetical protein